MADENPPKKSSLIRIAIIAAIILVANVAGAVLIFKFAVPMIYKTEENGAVGGGGENGKAPSDSGEGKAADEGGKEKKAKKGAHGKEADTSNLRQLEPVNLNPANSAGEILSTEMVIAGSNSSVIEEITTRDPEVRDVIITYLSYKTVGELNDITKREQFKKDIIAKLNTMLKNGKATGVFIRSWIIKFE